MKKIKKGDFVRIISILNTRSSFGINDDMEEMFKSDKVFTASFCDETSIRIGQYYWNPRDVILYSEEEHLDPIIFHYDISNLETVNE